MTDGWFPQFGGNRSANELFQARAGGSYLIKCSSSDNTWTFFIFGFFNMDFLSDHVQGQTCQVKFDPGAERVKAESRRLLQGRLMTPLPRLCVARWLRTEEEFCLEAWQMKSGYALGIFLFLLCTEIFYLGVTQIYLSSYRQALKMNVFFNFTR